MKPRGQLSPELNEGQLEAMVQLIVQKLEAHTVLLFGSAAKGTMRSDSDIDVAYISGTKHSAYERFIVAQELADLLKREVDLIDFLSASPVFKVQIITNGILLADNQQTHRQHEFIRALKEYAMLNEERKAIVSNLLSQEAPE